MDYHRHYIAQPILFCSVLSRLILFPELTVSQIMKRLLIVWNTRVFSAPKTLSRTHITKFTSGNFYFIIYLLLPYFSESVSEPTLISINTRWCSQEQADSFFSFSWKKYLLQSDKGKSHSNKMQQQQDKTNWSLFPKRWKLEEWWPGLTTVRLKRCVFLWGVFESMTHPGDKPTFCLLKLALLCLSASDAWEVLSCLPRACTAGRESWKVAAPDGAASLELIQAQAVLHE